MTSAIAPHPWSEEACFQKAAYYIEQMEASTPSDWRYGFWSSLALELLVRAALSRISPVLLADNKHWQNLHYALVGGSPSIRFTPTSIGTKEVLSRLTELLPAFNKEIAGFCAKHADRRNAELHSGELAFSSYGTSQWLAPFYQACKVLLESIDKGLEDIFSDPLTAESMIESLQDKAAAAVQQDINAHARVWLGHSEEERQDAMAKAIQWARPQVGHRVVCPACNSQALINGSPSGSVTTTLTEDGVEERQGVIPASFQCIACGLKIVGHSKLAACGLGDAFTMTKISSAADFFGLYTEEEVQEARDEVPDLEPDFNFNC
jgi:hypothetical protein